MLDLLTDRDPVFLNGRSALYYFGSRHISIDAYRSCAADTVKVLLLILFRVRVILEIEVMFQICILALLLLSAVLSQSLGGRYALHDMTILVVLLASFIALPSRLLRRLVLLGVTLHDDIHTLKVILLIFCLLAIHCLLCINF